MLAGAVLLLSICSLCVRAQGAATGGIYSVSEPTGPSGEVIPLSALGKSAIGLLVQTVDKKLLPLQIDTTGRVEAIPLREFVQHAPLSGRITDVKVELGDNVAAGEVLVTVDSPEINQLAAETLQNKADLEAEIVKTKAQLDAECDQARVQVDLSEAAYRRDKKLFEEGILAQKGLLESQAQLNLAQSRYRAALQKRDISLQALRTRLKVSFDSLSHRLRQLGVPVSDIKKMIEEQKTILSVPVTSARTGVITELAAFAGEGIDPKVPLFKISDLSEVWVTADVYEDDMARMKVGQAVTVSVAALPDESFRGTLAYIGRQVNPDSHTLPVRVEIPNPDIKLKPGMFATAHIQTASPVPAITLPREAVVDATGHHLVFLETKGGYQPCRVKVGRSLGDCVEILAGLSAGQRVVVRGAFQLSAELLKSHGVNDIFTQATEGERKPIEQEEKAGKSGSGQLSYQALIVVVIGAFVLGFVLSRLFQRPVRQDNSAEAGRGARADSGRMRG